MESSIRVILNFFENSQRYSKVKVHHGTATKRCLTHSVADPDPGLAAFLTPGSGIRGPGWEKVSIRIRDEQPGSYFLELRNHFFAFFGVKILKFFDEDPGSGMETVRILDGKGPIRDPG
jgi:hypothetical protein